MGLNPEPTVAYRTFPARNGKGRRTPDGPTWRDERQPSIMEYWYRRGQVLSQPRDVESQANWTLVPGRKGDDGLGLQGIRVRGSYVALQTL
jgi:hypothetical protein